MVNSFLEPVFYFWGNFLESSYWFLNIKLCFIVYNDNGGAIIPKGLLGANLIWKFLANFHFWKKCSWNPSSSRYEFSSRKMRVSVPLVFQGILDNVFGCTICLSSNHYMRGSWCKFPSTFVHGKGAECQSLLKGLFGLQVSW